MVGATSLTWWNCVRSPPASTTPFGQLRAMALRVPPQSEATCLVHWKGASSALPNQAVL